MNKEYHKQYYLKTRTKRLASQKKYREKNKPKIKLMITNWRKKNPSKVRLYESRRYKQHKVKRDQASRLRYRERYATDVNFRLKNLIRLRIRTAVTRKYRTSTSEELLGCSIQEARQYIEEKFLPGMTWLNYKRWHIDHVIPCAKFDLTKKSEQKKCFHYTNYQPLWALDNLRKGVS